MRCNDCNHDFVRRKDTGTCTKKRRRGKFVFELRQRGHRVGRVGGARFNPASTGCSLGEDGYAGTITTNPERLRYKSWDIKNAKLVLTKCNAMLAHPVLYYDTFNIVSLEQDTLFLRPEGKWTRTKYVKSTIDK